MLLIFFIAGYCSAQTDPTQKQVKFFFPGEKLAAGYQYHFPGTFAEVTIKTADSSMLNAVLFKADSSKVLSYTLKVIQAA